MQGVVFPQRHMADKHLPLLVHIFSRIQYFKPFVRHAYQSLAFETAIDTENPWQAFQGLKKRSQKGKQNAHRLKIWVKYFLWNAMMKKYNNAILSHINFAHQRIWHMIVYLSRYSVTTSNHPFKTQWNIMQISTVFGWSDILTLSEANERI